MIGWFVRYASRMSYSQLLLRSALQGEPAQRFMRTDPVSVTRDLSVSELVEQYMYKYHFQMFPVVEAGHLEGCITARDVKKVPRDDWPRTTVGEIAQRCTDENTIQRDSDALQALMLMNRTGNTRLVVAEGAQVAGVLTLKDLLGFLSFKLDLEGEDSSGRGPFRDGMA